MVPLAADGFITQHDGSVKSLLRMLPLARWIPPVYEAEMARITRSVATGSARTDVNIAIFAFLLSYPWEFLQVPFYQSMPSASHWSGVVICSTAALGDAIVMLVAFWLTALVARSGRWVVEPRAGHVALFVATGLLLTVVIEHVAVRSQWGWRYEPNMLVIPLLGTGLAPVLQWLILPPLTVWFVRRQVIGAQHVLAAERAHEADSHRK